MIGEFEKAIASAREARHSGRVVDAINGFQHAASLAREASLDFERAFALKHLGDVLQETGEFQLAQGAVHEAVKIYRAEPKNHSLDLANSLRIQALIEEALGHPHMAIDSWDEARVLYQECGITEGVHECESHLNALGAC